MEESLKKMAEKFITEYRDKIFGYVWLHVFDKSVVEDIVQDICMKIYLKISLYDSEKSVPQAWVYVITRNTVIDYFKTRHDCVNIDDVHSFATLSQNVVDTEDCVLAYEDGERLMNALEKIKEENRNIIIMRYFLGYNSAEIAKKLGLSHGNVRIILTRTLRKLKKILSE